MVLNQYDASILGFQDSRTAPIGTQITIQNRAIHVGGIFGAPSRVLAFLTSLSVIVQTMTGFFLWWRRRKAVPARSVYLPASARRPAETISGVSGK